MNFNVNNQRTMKVTQSQHDGEVIVQTIDPHGEPEADSTFSISPGDFVMLTNFQHYCSNHKIELFEALDRMAGIAAQGGFQIVYRNVDGKRIRRYYETAKAFLADVNDTDEENMGMPDWEYEVLSVQENGILLYSSLSPNPNAPVLTIEDVYRWFSNSYLTEDNPTDRRIIIRVVEGNIENVYSNIAADCAILFDDDEMLDDDPVEVRKRTVKNKLLEKEIDQGNLHDLDIK